MSFKAKVKASFTAVHKDIAALKENIVEWITTLVGNQKKILETVKDLESRVEKLEKKR